MCFCISAVALGGGRYDQGRIKKGIYISVRKFFWGGNKEETIGVLCRGTDYKFLRPKEHPRQPEPEDLFSIIDEWLNSRGYKYIYLMTEDENVRVKFIERYSDILYYSDHNCVNVEKNEFLSDAYKRNKIDIVQKNREYLIDLIALSMCGGLVAGRTSGSVMARVISDGYKDYYFWNDGRYGDGT